MKNLPALFTSLLLPATLWAADPTPDSAEGSQETIQMQMLSGKDFTNADLGDTRFFRVRLNQTDFSGADLTQVVFEQCDLNRADFSGAKLSDATTFRQVNLNDSNFSGVDFQKADLEMVNFRGSNLQKTKNYGDISRVNFSGADVRGADFSTATKVSKETFWKDVIYDDATKFPPGIDPVEVQAIKK